MLVSSEKEGLFENDKTKYYTTDSLLFNPFVPKAFLYAFR